MIPRWTLVVAAMGVAPLTSGGADRSPAPPDYYDSFRALTGVVANDANPITPEKVALGRVLFHEPRLSKNHDVACSDCHELARWGVDGRRVSLGHRDQQGTRNSPTVYNAASHLAQFWDGRSPDVEDQSKHPILNPVEMAMPDESRAVSTLRSMPGYVALFEQAFPGRDPAVTYETMALAIGAFERMLVTPARFDAFLEGDATALDEEQRRGFERFVELGCAACHNGPGVGGHSFEVLGLIEPYPDRTDLGVYEVTKRDADRMVFKVPGLRNVGRTAPYFHDGSVRSLADAIEQMAIYQLGVELDPADTGAVLTFLGSLTGALPAEYLEKPPLPESTAATPEPIPW